MRRFCRQANRFSSERRHPTELCRRSLGVHEGPRHARRCLEQTLDHWKGDLSCEWSRRRTPSSSKAGEYRSHVQICRRCGERNPDRARFCMGCATPFDTVSTRLKHARSSRCCSQTCEGNSTGDRGERLDPGGRARMRVPHALYDAARAGRSNETAARSRSSSGTRSWRSSACLLVPRRRRVARGSGCREGHELGGWMNPHGAPASEDGVGLNLRIGVNTGEVVAGDPQLEARSWLGMP